MPKLVASAVNFGQLQLPYSQLFILRKNVFATVNAKPIYSGHVLVCPRRSVKRLSELTEIETVEFWIAIQEVSKVLTNLTKQTCSISIQDGIDAGQSIEHVHCHIIPVGKSKLESVDAYTTARSAEEMAAEALKLRPHFEQSLL